MKECRVKDPDEVIVAVNRAREHAQALGKPLMLSRVALELGVTSDELNIIAGEMERKSEDENAQAICRAIKMAKQEGRADLEDFLAEGGNRGGYIFLAKVNHDMIERTQADVTFTAVRFTGEDEIPD